jgi:hypothetical protein
MRKFKSNITRSTYYSNYSILFDDLIISINAVDNNNIHTEDNRIIRFGFRLDLDEFTEIMYSDKNGNHCLTKDFYIS